MPKITFIDTAGTARTVEGDVGATVMETAIKHGVPGIEAECGGACACSTCHVYIEEDWREKVGEPSPMEEDMLDFAYEVKPNSRLSCQIKVREDIRRSDGAHAGTAGLAANAGWDETEPAGTISEPVKAPAASSFPTAASTLDTRHRWTFPLNSQSTTRYERTYQD